MENGTFQERIHDFSFVDKDRHEEFDLAESRPSSVDALMRQIDDLQARLKITVQRMAQVEDDLNQSKATQAMLQNMNQGLQDQILIWKEKDRLVIERMEKADQAQTQLKEQAETIQRYAKYHEKVKTQIKPYIKQLKAYSQNLLQQCQELNRDLANKDYLYTKAQARIETLEHEIATLTQSSGLAMAEIKSLHKTESDLLNQELRNLREENARLQVRSEKLEKSLARQDELENANVVLKRSLDDAHQKVHQETEGLRVSLQLARNEILKKTLQIESFEQSSTEQNAQIQRMQVENANLSDQLGSLRFMWTEKSTESEKLAQSLAALEKVNLELSQKLKSLRPEALQNL